MSHNVYEICASSLHASLPNIQPSINDAQIENEPIIIVFIKSDRINENKQ